MNKTQIGHVRMQHSGEQVIFNVKCEEKLYRVDKDLYFKE